MTIVYRSLLERRVMKFFDNSPQILAWNSETIIIPYISPLDNKVHRYFTDFWIQYTNKNNEIKSTIIEVKPASQTKPPVPKKNKTRRYIREATTWLVNEAKWKAATKYCDIQGWNFEIWTEKRIKDLS